MKKCIFVFEFLLVNLLLFGKVSAQDVLFHGHSEEDKATSLYLYNSNFYITGTTRKDAKSPTSYYVLVLNQNGSIRNKFVFGDVHGDYGKDIYADRNGIFVLGKSWDGGFSNNDMILYKLNHNGKQLWKKYYGDFHNDLGHAFIHTLGGDFVMTGHNRSVDDFGDMYLVKSDSDGNMIWERHFGDKYVDHGFAVAENQSGELVAAGTVGGFYNPTSTDFLNHDADIFIVKTTTTGNKLWENTYGGNSHDWAKDIIAVPGQGYYICGSTQSQGEGSFDMFLMKIDENGNQLWLKTFGGEDWEYGEKLRLGVDGNLYLLGTSASYSENYNPDHFLVKTDLDGEVIWSKIFGGVSSDYSSGLVVLPDSGCAFTGWTDSGLNGKEDVVFYKIKKDGSPESLSYLSPLNDTVNEVQIYPNPVSDAFSVFIDTSISDDFEMIMYSTDGQIVFQKNIEGNVLNTFENRLPPGLYIFTILQQNRKILNRKLIFR